MDYKDYYKVLNVSKSSSQEEISKAFKKIAKKYHPDLNPDDKIAESKFREANEAYEVLKDPEKRKMYDTLGPNWDQQQQSRGNPFGGRGGGGYGGGSPFGGGQAGGADFSDFFQSFFGGQGGGGGADFDDFGGFSQQAQPKKGSDIEVLLNISLEEAYHGQKKEVTIQTKLADDNGYSRLVPKTLEVTIPQGILNGQKIRLQGQGTHSKNGGENGDLYLKIAFAKHALFSVEEQNIIYDLHLAPWEAVLGVKVSIPTLDKELEMNIPKGINSGMKLRVKEHGLGKDTKKGDQFVRIIIKNPKELSKKEQELWEKLANISTFKARD